MASGLSVLPNIETILKDRNGIKIDLKRLSNEDSRNLLEKIMEFVKENPQKKDNTEEISKVSTGYDTSEDEEESEDSYDPETMELPSNLKLERAKLLKNEKHEPLLNEQKDRHVLFPITNVPIFKLYLKHIFSFWIPQEVKLYRDMNDWNKKLNENEKFFIAHVLAFFSSSDGVVIENLLTRFVKEIKLAESYNFYSFQAAMEAIHSHTYSLLIDTYIQKESERLTIFNAAQNFPAIKKKKQWAMKWIGSKETCFAERLVAFAAVEGIFFSGSFCAIYWIKKRNLLPGLCFANELISRDEALHCEHACELFRCIQSKPSQALIYSIISEAVSIEKEFICELLPCSLIGMNSKLMSEYIEFVSDLLLQDLGCEPMFGTDNPFEWMNMISLTRKTNFFEGEVSEYNIEKIYETLEELMERKIKIAYHSDSIILLDPSEF